MVKQKIAVTHEPDRSKIWPSLIILTMFTLLTFINSWPDSLVFDDRIFIGPEREHQLESLTEAFTQDLWNTPGGDGVLYRPLLLIDFELQHRLFGSWKKGYHVVNILFHLLTTLALFGFLRCLLRTTQPKDDNLDLYALLGALVFAVHPAHTEVVNSVFNKSSMYVALAAIVGLWWLLSNLEKRTVRAWAGFGVIYSAAILFKESALVLPGIAVAMIVLLTEGSLMVRIRRFLPVFWLLVPIAVYFWIKAMALAPEASSTATASEEINTLIRAAQHTRNGFEIQGLALLGQGLKILAWPYPLKLYHDLEGEAAIAVYIGIQVLLGVWAIYLLAKGRPILAFALTFYYLALMPSVRLVGLGDSFPLAERYLYFPSVGMTLALAFGFRALAFRLGRKHLSIIILPVLLVLAAISWDRNADWISEAQLFETEYQLGPPRMNTLRVLIATHYNQGRFRRVEEICDENASKFKRNIGFTNACAISYIRQERMDDAIAALETYAREGRHDDERNIARLALVPIYLALKNYQQVSSQYAAIIEEEEDPAYKEFYKGELLLTLFPEDREQLQKARQHFRQALEKDPKLRAAQKLITRIDRKLAEPD